MALYHNSRSQACRNPVGPVKAGTEITIRLLGASGTLSAEMRTWYNKKHRIIPLERLHDDTWGTTVTFLKDPGLFWYDFRIIDANGQERFVGSAPDGLGGEGVETDRPTAFQVTVYEPDYAVPPVFRDGIMYQIFPDRFFRSKMPKSPRKEIYLHEKWDEMPIMMPNSRTDNQAMDFFGGDLEGIRQKLSYLKSLGVTVLYLNPIFEARSNHRYDTGDYTKIDPLLGTEADFKRLCEEAREMGISVILDGVFNHTGDDSIYFNRYGTYPEKGAYQSKKSKWYKWYTFKKFPDQYDCWWGIDNVPTVNKSNEEFRRFIMGKDGIVARWLRAGASGWRLDVADELPMDMLREIRRRAKAEKPDSILLGEVWEDASHKEVWGETRCYCTGDTLDSVMNYPLREALLAFLTFRASSAQLRRLIESQQENYAPAFYYSIMNLLGSHDRPRTINTLAGKTFDEMSVKDRPFAKLTEEELALGKARYLDMLRIVCALPGIPCVYYGDEAGLWGAADPYNRGTYPWGHEDESMIESVREILKNRAESRILKTGHLSVVTPDDDTISIIRHIDDNHDVFGEQAENGTVCVTVRRK